MKATRPNIPVIVMTAHSDLDSAVTSIQKGAFEYLLKPFEVDEAIAVVDRALEQSSQGTEDGNHSQNAESLEIIEASTCDGGGFSGNRKTIEIKCQCTNKWPIRQAKKE